MLRLGWKVGSNVDRLVLVEVVLCSIGTIGRVLNKMTGRIYLKDSSSIG